MRDAALAIADYGEAAVMVTVRGAEARIRQERIRCFRERVLEEPPPGLEDCVSGLESLLVEFDPLAVTSEQISFSLGLLDRTEAPTGAQSRSPRAFYVPIVVDDDTAPDLAEVADELGITTPELVERIERSELCVSLLAAAMAPMMTGLDVPAPVRRRQTPRTNVAAGSLMIAADNAIIQPFPGPTGWRVVGRTTLRIVDISRPAPVSFAPGDTFRFRCVSAADAQARAGEFLEEQQ